MINMILKSYSAILLAIGFASLAVFIFGLYMLFRPTAWLARPRLRKTSKAQSAEVPAQTKLVVTSSDISAIAGDDVMTTQLDLARAYIETGRHLLAKKILEYVRTHGNDFQQEEADRLLEII
jgi:FimV-like protein